MPTKKIAVLRRYRNSRLYRPLGRVLRVYNRRLVAGLHARGFTDFASSFPALLSNLDTEGSSISVLAARAGVTRQAAGQLLKAIEQCGYVRTRTASHDARTTTVKFTPRGRKLLATIFELVEQVEGEFAALVGRPEFDRLRADLERIADAVDPGGALGRNEQ